MFERNCPEPITITVSDPSNGEWFGLGESGLIYDATGKPLATGERPDIEQAIAPNCTFLPGEAERLMRDTWRNPQWLDHMTGGAS